MRAFAVFVILVSATASSVAQSIGVARPHSEGQPAMFVRSYKVDRNDFRTMRRLVNATEEVSELEVFRTFSGHKGLDLSAPTEILYAPGERLLVVRSTKERLDSVEQVVAAVKPKLVNVSEVDSKSVTLTAMDWPQPNLTFKYVSKSPQEVQMIARRYPEAPVLVIKDGLVIAEAGGCTGYKERVGADKHLDYVGLVLVFDNCEEARCAEKALKHDDERKQ